MWLCSLCMTLHAWRTPCKGLVGVLHEYIAGPVNGASANILIHGIVKPLPVLNDVVVVSESVSRNDDCIAPLKPGVSCF